MPEQFHIAGYARISVDEELDRDNVSIENQKAIIREYVRTRFPDSTLTFFEDRDRSGYTFEQREGYQEMRRGLVEHRFAVLIVKDFSRFSRRNSRGLVELEDLRDAGVRIISIGDGIDFPDDNDWLKIQFQFLINEMPVTDTSKKVKSVIRRRQAEGRWICAAPYGYLVNRHKEFEIVPAEAEVVRKIFDLYNNGGWGYKKIANYLTEQGIPTPRMAQQMRRESEGGDWKRPVKSTWATVTVQGILDNDFYIGTLRQGKYTRAKINGKDVKRDEEEQIVLENHHPPILDPRTFAATRALRKKRSVSHYRGIKKYSNSYSGFLFCGDCGQSMVRKTVPSGKKKYVYYVCAASKIGECSTHSISETKLTKAVFHAIHDQIEVVLEIDKTLNYLDSLPSMDRKVLNYETQIEKLEEEIERCQRLKLRLYEDLADGIIDKAEYSEFRDSYTKTITQKKEALNRVHREYKDTLANGITERNWVTLFREYENIDELNRRVLMALVDKIIIHENHVIEILYKYRDEYKHAKEYADSFSKELNAVV